MATQLQLRRGTATEINNFTGADGELVYNKSAKSLHVHDGTKKGGWMIDTLVAFQAPSSANNWTWYRKYASGWVEQGGQATIAAQNTNTQLFTDVNLPITMANQAYMVNVAFVTDGGNTTGLRNNSNGRGTTKLTIGTYSTSGISNSYMVAWEVKGMAA